LRPDLSHPIITSANNDNPAPSSRAPVGFGLATGHHSVSGIDLVWPEPSIRAPWACYGPEGGAQFATPHAFSNLPTCQLGKSKKWHFSVLKAQKRLLITENQHNNVVRARRAPPNDIMLPSPSTVLYYTILYFLVQKTAPVQTHNMTTFTRRPLRLIIGDSTATRHKTWWA